MWGFILLCFQNFASKAREAQTDLVLLAALLGRGSGGSGGSLNLSSLNLSSLLLDGSNSDGGRRALTTEEELNTPEPVDGATSYVRKGVETN